MKTKQIDNLIPHIEVSPRRLVKKGAIDVAQMTDPYAGEIGLCFTENSQFYNELVIYNKHVKKKLIVDGQELFFVPEHEIMCGIELEEGYEALPYMDKEWMERYARQADDADGPQFQDNRLKNYVPGGISLPVKKLILPR